MALQTNIDVLCPRFCPSTRTFLPTTRNVIFFYFVKQLFFSAAIPMWKFKSSKCNWWYWILCNTFCIFVGVTFLHVFYYSIFMNFCKLRLILFLMDDKLRGMKSRLILRGMKSRLIFLKLRLPNVVFNFFFYADFVYCKFSM